MLSIGVFELLFLIKRLHPAVKAQYVTVCVLFQHQQGLLAAWREKVESARSTKTHVRKPACWTQVAI